MVNEGIVFGHKFFERGIEVDKAKVDAIEKMPCPRISVSSRLRSVSSSCNNQVSVSQFVHFGITELN